MDFFAEYGYAIVIGVVGFFGGIAIGCALGAMVLRLVAQWLGYPTIGFLTALKAVFLSNATLLSLGLLIGFNHGMVLSQLAGEIDFRYDLPRTMAHFFTPMFFLILMIVGFMTTGFIFSRTLPGESEGKRLSFLDGCGLGTLTQALTFGVLFFLFISVFLFITVVNGIAGI